ncbi:MAG: hypothetical protein U0995_13665 [Erythrobacter sp.]|nr:hypothetical protein [Erythrobacter sp.]MDZ4271606.1 hypothetical protein [Erythrobacter sp.]MDZ4277087.1 hypothetical protein [Erythrobacter sp.]
MLELFNIYRTDAQHIASVLLALAIWRWGAAPERWLIAVFIAAMVVPVKVFEWLDLGNLVMGQLSWVYVTVDLLAGVGFVVVALNANRNYPLWIAGFQLVAISAHGVKSMVDSVSPLAYLVLAAGPSYCQLALIFAGFARHVTRTRQFGPYRDWRSSAPGAQWPSL